MAVAKDEFYLAHVSSVCVCLVKLLLLFMEKSSYWTVIGLRLRRALGWFRVALRCRRASWDPGCGDVCDLGLQIFFFPVELPTPTET